MRSASIRDSTDIDGGDLRALRVAKRVTISEIARRCGVSKQATSLLERPGRYVTASAADRYLAALHAAVESRAERTRSLWRRALADDQDVLTSDDAADPSPIGEPRGRSREA